MSRNRSGVLRTVAAVSVALFACLLLAAPAGAQDGGSGAYVGSDTTVYADEPQQQAVASSESVTPPAATDPSGALPQKLPYTGGDVAQAAVIGAFVLLAGIAALGWRRRTASA